MSWFEKIVPSRIKTERRSRSVPEGLWVKCPACDAVLYRAELERNLNVCPKCSHHMRIGARARLKAFLDPEGQVEVGASVTPEDPLKFKDSKRYRDRIAQAQKATGERDALVVHRELDALAMQAAADDLVGEHDFSAFRAAECQAHSPVRRVEALTVRRRGNWVCVQVTANAFLHHMVRNIVGTLLAIGRGDAPRARAREQLESRQRSTGEATAAAHGLYFWQADYPPEFGLPDDSAIISPIEAVGA